MWPMARCEGLVISLTHAPFEGRVVSLTHALLWGLGELESFERGIGGWTTLSDALDLPAEMQMGKKHFNSHLLLPKTCKRGKGREVNSKNACFIEMCFWAHLRNLHGGLIGIGLRLSVQRIQTRSLIIPRS